MHSVLGMSALRYHLTFKHRLKRAAGYSNIWTRGFEDKAGQIQCCSGGSSHWLLTAYCLNVEEFCELVIKPMVTSN